MADLVGVDFFDVVSTLGEVIRAITVMIACGGT